MSFTLNLFRQVLSEDDTANGNVFLSPTSILAAMGIAAAGTNTETETELLNCLGLEGDYSDIHVTLGVNLDNLNSDTVRIANRMWVNPYIAMNDSYREFVSSAYRSEVSSLDVSTPLESAARVNGWVSEQTHGMIPDLISAEMAPAIINSDLLMLITNAIAYQGSWVTQFDTDNTMDAPFRTGDGTSVDVPMMFNPDLRIPFHSTRLYTGISLPLEGGVEMVLIVPQTKWWNPDTRTQDTLTVTLSDVVEALEEADLNTIIDAWDSEVLLRMPRWEMETEYDLIPTFQNLGVKKAFGGADFSRMSPERIEITAIIHKAKITVNEKGAEMAAATVVACGLESYSPQYPVTLDQPFLFFAVDKATRTVLFAGRMNDPSL